MKEKYITPDIAFESFELSRSIAANCDVATTQGLNADGIADDGGRYFTENGPIHEKHGMQICTYWVSESNPIPYFEDYCYWTGTGSKNFFCS